MTAAAAVSPTFIPPHPQPHKGPRGALSTILALRRNPLEVWSEAHFKRPVLIGRSILGLRAAVHEPSAVKRIFLDNAGNYRKDDLQLRVLSPGLGNGLLTSEGDNWRAQRRALAPLFSPRQVGDFAQPMLRVAQRAVERLKARREGAIVEIGDLMSRLTLEVLEQTLFSQGLGREASAFQQAVTRYFNTFGRLDLLDLVGAPQFLPRLGRWRGRSTLGFFNEAVDAIIAQRRVLIESGAAAPKDLLTLLMRAQDPQTGQGMSVADVRANIVTFIAAGHETTANTLTWSLYLLSQSPAWRLAIEREIDERFDSLDPAEATEALPATRAVVEEALRLYPPAAILSREAIADDELAGVPIPAGTIVTVSPFVLHRHILLWDDPDAFDPGRFLGERRERIDRFAYIPFGAGPRVCIGMGFALQEAVLALAAMLNAFRFDLVEGHEVVAQQRVTLRPRYGLRMHVRRRGKPMTSPTNSTGGTFFANSD